VKTAIVVGATGLTGKHITNCLLESDDYAKVIVFSRRLVAIKHPKLCNHLIDFEKFEDWCDLLLGDDLFLALGTTKKQAGSKEAQYRIDYTYQANVIEAAAKSAVKRLFLVSSPQANINSSFFYPRMKGQLEEFARKQHFKTLVFFKPTLIEGERSDDRPMEKVGSSILHALAGNITTMKSYQPILGSQLGRAIVNCASGQLSLGEHSFERAKIFDFL